MKMTGAFEWDMKIASFLSLAEVAIWGYFLFNLAFVLIRFQELRSYWQAPAHTNENQPLAIKYLKRAGFALAVAGIFKILQALYTLFTLDKFAGI